jgi:hypothetical protein
LTSSWSPNLASVPISRATPLTYEAKTASYSITRKNSVNARTTVGFPTEIRDP